MYGIAKATKKIRERWHNYLNPNIKKGIWTLEEHKTLFEMVLKIGRKWSKISKEIPGRNEHSVKNEFRRIFRKMFPD
jgi:myb proto-oncogene protein